MLLIFSCQSVFVRLLLLLLEFERRSCRKQSGIYQGSFSVIESLLVRFALSFGYSAFPLFERTLVYVSFYIVTRNGTSLDISTQCVDGWTLIIMWLIFSFWCWLNEWRAGCKAYYIFCRRFSVGGPGQIRKNSRKGQLKVVLIFES